MKIRKDSFFRVLARNPQAYSIRKKWSYDGSVDGIAYQGRNVDPREFVRDYGPGGPHYKVVVVYQSGDKFDVFDRYGGQLFSFEVRPR